MVAHQREAEGLDRDLQDLPRVGAVADQVPEADHVLAVVGGGVLEYRIDWGPGYRVYLGRDGATLVILLGGGTKRRQRDDIRAAQERWSDYRRRRQEEG